MSIDSFVTTCTDVLINWLMSYLHTTHALLLFVIMFSVLLVMQQQIDWLKDQDETFCSMKVWFHLIKTASAFCPVSSHEKKSNSVSFHKKKIWFCLISWKKNLILSHLIKKKLILSHFIKKKSHSVLILSQVRIRTEQEILISTVSI